MNWVTLLAEQGGVLDGALKGAAKGAIIGAVVGGLFGLIFGVMRLFKGNSKEKGRDDVDSPSSRNQ